MTTRWPLALALSLFLPALAPAQDPAGALQLHADQRLTGTLADAPLPEAINALAAFDRLSVVAPAGALDPTRRVSLRLDGLTPAEALDAVCAWAGLTCQVHRRTLLIAPARAAAPVVEAEGPREPLAELLPRLEKLLLEDPAQAERLVDEDPRVLWIHEWSRGTASYAKPGRLSVTLRRAEGGDEVAVVLPPGTYAERRGESGPAPQDLALLTPLVVLVPAGQSEARATAPVACAQFEVASPQDGQVYTLRAWRRGTTLERLLRAVAALPEAERDGPAAQLAVWILRDRITAARLSQRNVVTFAGAQVTAQHGEGAAALLRAAAIPPEQLPFFSTAPAGSK